MLCEITIENVAVIEKAAATFAGGFTVLTGETGAGKSILIDSINAILGSRASRDLVRSGAEKAKIWARFSEVDAYVARHLEEAGYPLEEELLLYREIAADGKSNCRINGMPATATIIRDICNGLVQIHGQHDNQSLMNPAKHIRILDAFAQNGPLLEEYEAAYTQLSNTKNEIYLLSKESADKTRRLDLLQYELHEITEASLEIDEEQRLAEQRTVIRNAQAILDALNGAYQLLYGGEEEQGAVTLLSQASSEISHAAKYDEELGTFAGTLEELHYSADEIASVLNRRLEEYRFDAGALDRIEQRIDLLYRLRQKYGATVDEVIAYGQRAEEEIQRITFADERIAGLKKIQQEFETKVSNIAENLSKRRSKAFEALRKELAKALEFLNMPGIEMALDRREIPFGPTGNEEIEFLISANPGEPPKSLAKIASGGELARIMLALKSALADRDDLATVIYDEIDTGISGLAAVRIGQLLQETARGRQVICVTHTAQIASYANQHLLIEKHVRGGRTYTEIAELDHAERTRELARIISGDHLSDTALANAKEMLEHAKL